jgi:prephenate dehydrogenase
MAQFDHVAIVGVGLIGGSFALALRDAGFDGRITGWDNTQSLELALDSAIIDAPEESFEREENCEADLIYLSAPIESILEFLGRHGKKIKAGALVTDSGSTKRTICAAAQALAPEIDFIGGHPMAGSQQHGVAAAKADLFKDAAYILVPRDGTAELRVLQFELLLREIGARPLRLSAEAHDDAVAVISHLPQLLSTALVQAVAAHRGEIDARQLAGPGYRDMTRLASSSWAVWHDICATNRDFIGLALDELIMILQSMRISLSEEEMRSIEESFIGDR